MIKIIYPDGAVETPASLTFSGGEEHINLATKRQFSDKLPIKIRAQLLSSKEVMRLLLITNALKLLYPNPIELFVPYLPYARQDRACAKGDAFSLKVFADLINSQDYSKVATVDAHSDVASTLINNFEEIPQARMLPGVRSRLDGGIKYIVSPDSGSQIKAQTWVAEWNRLTRFDPVEWIVAHKKRDPTNGAITETTLDVAHDLSDGNCLIADDICDGGRTFSELAKVLRDKGAAKIFLYVTHGIFSKGVEAVGVDQIFTTDTFPEKDDGTIVVKRFFY